MTLRCLPALLILAAGWAISLSGLAAAEDRLFEMRIYTAHEGKLDALHARFRDHTNRLFEKHGMDLVGYWTPVDGEGDTLIYILAYPDQASRDASWEAFFADPEWQNAAAESRRDGPLVKAVESRMMNPTDYSPIK